MTSASTLDHFNMAILTNHEHQTRESIGGGEQAGIVRFKVQGSIEVEGRQVALKIEQMEMFEASKGCRSLRSNDRRWPPADSEKLGVKVRSEWPATTEGEGDAVESVAMDDHKILVAGLSSYAV